MKIYTFLETLLVIEVCIVTESKLESIRKKLSEQKIDSLRKHSDVDLSLLNSKTKAISPVNHNKANSEVDSEDVEAIVFEYAIIKCTSMVKNSINMTSDIFRSISGTLAGIASFSIKSIGGIFNLFGDLLKDVSLRIVSSHTMPSASNHSSHMNGYQLVSQKYKVEALQLQLPQKRLTIANKVFGNILSKVLVTVLLTISKLAQGFGITCMFAGDTIELISVGLGQALEDSFYCFIHVLSIIQNFILFVLGRGNNRRYVNPNSNSTAKDLRHSATSSQLRKSSLATPPDTERPIYAVRSSNRMGDVNISDHLVIHSSNNSLKSEVKKVIKNDLIDNNVNDSVSSTNSVSSLDKLRSIWELKIKDFFSDQPSVRISTTSTSTDLVSSSYKCSKLVSNRLKSPTVNLHDNIVETGFKSQLNAVFRMNTSPSPFLSYLFSKNDFSKGTFSDEKCEENTTTSDFNSEVNAMEYDNDLVKNDRKDHRQEVNYTAPNQSETNCTLNNACINVKDSVKRMSSKYSSYKDINENTELHIKRDANFIEPGNVKFEAESEEKTPSNKIGNSRDTIEVEVEIQNYSNIPISSKYDILMEKMYLRRMNHSNYPFIDPDRPPIPTPNRAFSSILKNIGNIIMFNNDTKYPKLPSMKIPMLIALLLTIAFCNILNRLIFQHFRSDLTEISRDNNTDLCVKEEKSDDLQLDSSKIDVTSKKSDLNMNANRAVGVVKLNNLLGLLLNYTFPLLFVAIIWIYLSLIEDIYREKVINDSYLRSSYEIHTMDNSEYLSTSNDFLTKLNEESQFDSAIKFDSPDIEEAVANKDETNNFDMFKLKQKYKREFDIIHDNEHSDKKVNTDTDRTELSQQKKDKARRQSINKLSDAIAQYLLDNPTDNTNMESLKWLNSLIQMVWIINSPTTGLGKYISNIIDIMLNRELALVPQGIANIQLKHFSIGSQPPLLLNMRSIYRPTRTPCLHYFPRKIPNSNLSMTGDNASTFSEDQLYTKKLDKESFFDVFSHHFVQGFYHMNEISSAHSLLSNRNNQSNNLNFQTSTTKAYSVKSNPNSISMETCQQVIGDIDFLYVSKDLDFVFTLRPNDVKSVLPETMISISDFTIKGRLRMHIDLIPEYPFFGNATVSFIDLPVFDITVSSFGGIELSSIPGVYHWINITMIWLLEQVLYCFS